MYEFDSLSSGGRTLCCAFFCQRCGMRYDRPPEECLPGDGGDRYLRNLRVPEGWSDHFYGWLLCAECTEKLRKFIRMEDEDGK